MPDQYRRELFSDCSSPRDNTHIELMEQIPNVPIFGGQDSCVICFDDLFTECVQLTCGGDENSQNSYHRECLTEWLSKKLECPLCRCKEIINTHIVADHLPNSTK